jgi:HAD superfamily hydrolase (TIGR01509 family)
MRVGLAGLVDARVDAAVFHLPGNLAPDRFLEAARRLGVDPGRGVLFEDALAGVEAGRHGGFGRVAGVDRGGSSACAKPARLTMRSPRRWG